MARRHPMSGRAFHPHLGVLLRDLLPPGTDPDGRALLFAAASGCACERCKSGAERLADAMDAAGCETLGELLGSLPPAPPCKHCGEGKAACTECIGCDLCCECPIECERCGDPGPGNVFDPAYDLVWCFRCLLCLGCCRCPELSP